MMNIAAVDIFETGDIIHAMMSIEPTDAVDENFGSLGFESKYFLVNLGSMVVFVIFYILGLIISPILSICSFGRFKGIKKLRNKLNRKIFWGTLIVLMNESYMVIIVCLLINIKILSTASAGLQAMSIMCVTLLFLSVFLPAFFLTKLYRDFEELETKDMKLKYGALYEDLRLDIGRKVLFQPGFFLLRRALLAVSVCFAGEYLIV